MFVHTGKFDKCVLLCVLMYETMRLFAEQLTAKKFLIRRATLRITANCNLIRRAAL